jgi:hypothetical protein
MLLVFVPYPVVSVFCPPVIFWVLDLMSKQERDKPLGSLHICLIILAKAIETFGFLPLCCEKQKQ